jgi:uracil-DNA glycosylase family 4
MDELRCVAVQHLESLRRAGVVEWRHVAAAALPTPPVSSERALASEDTRQWHPKSAATAARPAGPPSRLFTEAAEPTMPKANPAAAARCQTFQPLDLPLAERNERLAALKTQVAVCVRCQELASTRKQTVFGVGNPQARFLFIGEAPGADEDAQGEPFVGRAGQLLNDIIRACRLQREDVYICNVLRCRPPGNRLPSPQEADNCREFLDGQIALVNPEYIVCWGSCAAKNLLGSEEAIGKLRGRFFKYGRAKVLCTYHPSYLLRNPAAKKDVWEDMKLLFLDAGVDLTAKQ